MNKFSSIFSQLLSLFPCYPACITNHRRHFISTTLLKISIIPSTKNKCQQAEGKQNMPKKVNPMAYREILRRLNMKQSTRSIHRDSGFSQELIRKVRDIAKLKGCLDASFLSRENEILKYINHHPSKC